MAGFAASKQNIPLGQQYLLSSRFNLSLPWAKTGEMPSNGCLQRWTCSLFYLYNLWTIMFSRQIQTAMANHDGNLFTGSFTNSFPLQFSIFVTSRHPRGMGYKIYSVWTITLDAWKGLELARDIIYVLCLLCRMWQLISNSSKNNNNRKKNHTENLFQHEARWKKANFCRPAWGCNMISSLAGAVSREVAW